MVAGIEGELRLIRRLGGRLLGALVAVVAATFAWAALAGWYGSAIHTDVARDGRTIEELRGDAKSQGARLDKIEQRLDGIEGKLDALINRMAPKAGG
jgi:hypothetical protein